MWIPRPILDPWTDDQARVAACFPAHRRVVVPAANGVGKTFLAADLVVSFILDMPAAAIIITAPTNRQVSELLWPHITDRLLHEGLADVEWRIPTQPKWSGGDGDTLIGFATNSPQRMQGFHAKHLLVVIDEASGMPRSLIEALEGIAVAEANYLLAIGNPNEAAGAFHEMTRLPSWHTEEISALTHPNILARAEVIPGATTWRSMVDRIRDWCTPTPEPNDETFSVEISDVELQTGPDPLRKLRHFVPNDAFRIRYLGRFPATAQWSLINPTYIRAALDATIQGDRPKIAALDVARKGGDRTIYGLRQGDSLTSLRTIAAVELTTQAEEVAARLREDDPESITVDAAGLGIGLIDRLRELTNVPVIAFQGAEEPVSPSQRKRYFNRRAAAYGHLQVAFEARRISLLRDAELVEELAAVRYKHTEDGRMQMLLKEEIARDLGRSPDKADMLSLLWEHGTDFAWGQPDAEPPPVPAGWLWAAHDW